MQRLWGWAAAKSPWSPELRGEAQAGRYLNLYLPYMKYKNSTFHFLANGERNLSKAAETELFLLPPLPYSHIILTSNNHFLHCLRHLTWSVLKLCQLQQSLINSLLTAFPKKWA